jgi:lipopolysaccharide/colanic/teichoic acid biosynthesis glycosyltransferase
MRASPSLSPLAYIRSRPVATIPRELELDFELAVNAEHLAHAAAWPTLQLALKRALDTVCAAIAIAVLLLPALVLALLIKLDSRGPTLLTQQRVGRLGRTFTVYKFRTMCEQAEQMLPTLLSQNEKNGSIFKMREDPRITRVGRWLRKTSLDELPQLINVLRGEMSLVGPRPPLPREVARYSPHELGRLAVKPGITGLWQVSGRSQLSWEQMVELDLEYIQRFSVAGDVVILLRTLPAVISMRGAY